MTDQRHDDSPPMLAPIEESAAFEEIVATHTATVYRYLARRVGPDLAEDLTAEVFLAAFRARRRYRDEHSTALPWLYGVASNILRNHRRAERRRLEALAQIVTSARDVASEDSVEEAAALTAAAQRVSTAVAELKPAWREVVVLVAVEGLSAEEASEALEVAVGTVRSRLSRARRRLRQDLADLFDSEDTKKLPQFDSIEKEQTWLTRLT